MKLTWKEVFSQLDIGASTAAFYRDRYEPWFKFTGEGRHRKYHQESVEVLSCIVQLYSEGKTYEAIKDVLEKRYGVPGEVIPPENRTTENQQDLISTDNITITNQQEIIIAIRDIFREELAKRDDIILELQEEMESMKGELGRSLESVKETVSGLRGELNGIDRNSEDRDERVMEAINAIRAEAQQKKNRTWWRRLLGK